MADPIKIDIWSDIACPWCFIGKRRFEAGAAEAGGKIGIGPVDLVDFVEPLRIGPPMGEIGRISERRAIERRVARRRGRRVRDATQILGGIQPVAAGLPQARDELTRRSFGPAGRRGCLAIAGRGRRLC